MKRLALAWTSRLVAGPARRAAADAAFGPAPPTTIVGGVGDNDFVGATIVKGGVLAVDGVLYVTAPDNVWALDAHDGRELWHYFWKTRGGTHIGNRGVGMWGNYLFFVTPDDYLVSLDAQHRARSAGTRRSPLQPAVFLTIGADRRRQSRHRWHGQRPRRARVSQSFDPETGKQQWRCTRCR